MFGEGETMVNMKVGGVEKEKKEKAKAERKREKSRRKGKKNKQIMRK